MSVREGFRQVAVATRMLLLESSRELGLVLGFSVIFPVGILFFLNVLAAPDLRVQALVGTIMLDMALLNVNALAQTMGQDKARKEFDLWVSLPVRPAVYTAAVALSYLPYSLAAAAVTLGVGIAGFHIPVPTSTIPTLFAGFFLVWASTLGIGFLIGALGRTPRQINSYAQLIGILLTFFAPVFYPVTVLPVPLQWVAYAWPLTWGSRYLTAVVVGNPGVALEAAAVLAGYVVLWSTLIALGLRWRQT